MLNFIKALNLCKLTPKEANEVDSLLPYIFEIFYAHFQPLTEEGSNFVKTFTDEFKRVHELKVSEILAEYEATNAANVQQNNLSDNDIWIFGYGSLIWKVDFPYTERQLGFIRGYKRRFYQYSIDHRGVPQNPGRVVTLLPGDDTTDCVHGIAYRIAAKDKENVLNHLDYREKNGYQRCNLTFYKFPKSNAETLNVIMYVATDKNSCYAPQPSDHIIAQNIMGAIGPSGTNLEYFYNLYASMQALFPGITDHHLVSINNFITEIKLVREIEPIENAIRNKIQKILADSLTDCDDMSVAEKEISAKLVELVKDTKLPHLHETLKLK